MPSHGGKDKGRGAYAPHAGLGRLRRAHAKKQTRQQNLERMVEDEGFLDLQDDSRKTSHSAEGLLLRFNRLARDAATATGTPGTICGFDGFFVLVRHADGTEHACVVRKILSKMLRGEKTPLCVGDHVRFEQPATGDPVVVAVLPRDNQLERADSHNKGLVQVFAANIDRLVIVAAMGEPPFKPGLIDRYLVIAHASSIEPIIVINKADLGVTAGHVARYQALGYPVIATMARDGRPTDDAWTTRLQEELSGRTCVFAGQSGVGKTSLIRSLFPGCEARIGAVSQATNKGRHTTNASRSYLLDATGTNLIDTPGIRECGITGLEPLDVAMLYRDIAGLQQDCRFPNCTHTHEPECAVKAAVDSGDIDPLRYCSYLSILEDDLA